MQSIHPSRRRLLTTAAVAAAASALPRSVFAVPSPTPTQTVSHKDPFQGLKIGIASYSLQRLPVDACVKAIQKLDLHYVSIKDFHLPLKSSMEERKQVAQKFRDAGIEPLSCGVINMKNDEKDVKNAFEYAKAAGIPTIVCSPDPEAIKYLDKYVKEYDIRCAIHNHGPSDKKYPSPYDAFKLIENLDKRVGLCVDVGHTARTNTDPAHAILDLRDRVYDIHLKDLDSKEPNGKATEVGRGVLDIRAILAALKQINFPGHVGLEYEKDLKGDPMPGIAESIGYVRGILAPAPATT